MAGERPQFANYDLSHEEQAAAPADLEPLDGVPQTGFEWSAIPRRPTFDDLMTRGSAAYNHAAELERLGKLETPEDEEYELSPDTVTAYKEASTYLLAAHAEATTSLREDEPVDPVRLLMIGTSLAQQAAAPIVESYGGDPLTAHSMAPEDRRAHLKKIARQTLQRASDMMYGDAENAAWGAEFDNAFKPAEILATAAVEAAVQTGTAEYTPVDENTAQELHTEGHPAVSKFIEEHAEHPEGAKFLAAMGHLAVEEMATQEYVYLRAA